VIRLAVRVPARHAELVLAELLELAPAGVEELRTDAGTVEYAVYGAAGELPGLPDLKALAGGVPVEISTAEIADDWHERWKDFHRPVLIAAPRIAGGSEAAGLPALRIRPPWEPAGAGPAGEGAVLELVIDPGQAFGTGAHASTRLCLELLLALAGRHGRSGRVLDVGTGSGVLAIAAGMLGFEPLLGLDNERESVQAARQNAAVNSVELRAGRFDLRRDPLPWIGAGAAAAEEQDDSLGPTIVLANLLRPLLLDLAGVIERPPSHLIAGGLLVEELDEVADSFRSRHGLAELMRRADPTWGALWLSREG
jgi:ribosomal protein L11 methyltransferase